jgi:hypothetical protein
MVYAMFSIGILGLLVWSLFFHLNERQVALLHREMEVINLAICWNSSTLLGTFYSNNLSGYTQSAGNRGYFNDSSSSETTRETTYFNFTAFLIYSKLNFTNQISDDWNAWFIGFAEGDGSILIRDNHDLYKKEKY